MKLIFLCFSLLIHHEVLGRVHHVGMGKPHQSIRSVLTEAKRLDTIFVYKGVYTEGNLVLDIPLVLIGIDDPVLDGQEMYEVLSIKSDSVWVEGFTIRNSGVSSTIDFAAIKIYESSHVVIKSNRIQNAFFGIYSQGANHCEISSNTLEASGINEQRSANGIHCWKCNDMRIIGNEIHGHRDGIYFEFVTGSVIWRNISSGNMRYGLHFMFSNNDAYISNVFKENGAGVAVMFSHGVRMYSNVFEDNWGDSSYGILLKEISDSHIEGNYFLRNTSGIFMEGASRVSMLHNKFQGNGWGLKIQASCMDILLKWNDFTANSFDVGSNGSLVLNTFENNYWDKYEGYDLNKDGLGDIPYRPVSLFSMVMERNPEAVMLFRSLISGILDRSERVVPSLTPEKLMDVKPAMKPQTR